MGDAEQVDSVRRIRKALDTLIAACPDVKVRPPPSKSKLAELVEEAGPLAPGLDAYFACCNGVGEALVSPLLSVKDMLTVDSPGFFAISSDGGGNHDLVSASWTHGRGAVVFWDHEQAKTEYVVASSVTSYVELWVKRTTATLRGKKDPTRGKWPFDATFMEKHDPAAVKLSRSRKVAAQLGDLDVLYVDRTGKVKPRVGINPFTMEKMVFPAPPRHRRKP